MNNSNKPRAPSRRARYAPLIAALLLAACGADDAVDPALVGSWEIPVAQGSWRLTIDGAGQYSFSNEGAGSAASHSGEFSARDGEWSLRSTTAAIEDHGRYEVVAGQGLKLTGNLGAISWARAADAATTAAVPLPTAADAPAGGQPGLAGPAGAEPPSPPATQIFPGAPSEPQRAARIPDIIDPCLLVTAEEAGLLLGAAVTTKRTTPQPLTQNDCFYRAAEGTFSVTSFNGRGLDPAGYLERRRSSGGVNLPGVGDGAVVTYRNATGLTSVNFVVGTASVEILVSGVPAERADAAMRAYALQAATRLVTPAARFDVPGLEGFVGVWRVETHGPSGGSNAPDMVFWVEADGRVRMQTSATIYGTLEIEGNRWRVENPLYQQFPGGGYRLRGDRLSLDGDSLVAELQRVTCGAGPKSVKPPYELARNLGGSMRSTSRLPANARPPASKSFDAKLVGLWEGTGKLGILTVQAIVSIDERGYAVFALFPHAAGHFKADDGKFELELEGIGASTGTYQFAGGISDGIIRMVEGDSTLVWTPTDPVKRPVYETPLVANCG